MSEHPQGHGQHSALTHNHGTRLRGELPTTPSSAVPGPPPPQDTLPSISLLVHPKGRSGILEHKRLSFCGPLLIFT